MLHTLGELHTLQRPETGLCSFHWYVCAWSVNYIGQDPEESAAPKWAPRLSTPCAGHALVWSSRSCSEFWAELKPNPIGTVRYDTPCGLDWRDEQTGSCNWTRGHLVYVWEVSKITVQFIAIGRCTNWVCSPLHCDRSIFGQSYSEPVRNCSKMNLASTT